MRNNGNLRSYNPTQTAKLLLIHSDFLGDYISIHGY